MIASASQLLGECVAAALTPRVKAPVDVWCDANRVLLAKSSAEPGRWNTDRTPYLRRPMRLFANTRTRMLVMMAGSQLGKTELIENCKLYAIDQDPGPTLVMLGNIDSVRDYNQDRFLPAIHACPAVRRHLLPSPQETKNLKINFDACTYWFVGSNSASGRRMRPCRRVFCDEVGTYEDPEWPEVLERVKTFADSKLVITSTPGEEGTGVGPYFESGSKERFWVPCPHCRGFQVLVFPQLKWDGGGKSDQAAATARYECVNCKNRVYDHHKPAMLRDGVWIAGARSERRGWMTEAEALELNADLHQAPEIASFQISSLYSPFTGAASFGSIASVWVRGGGQVSQGFVTGYLGEEWKDVGERIDTADLKLLTRHGGYSLGQVPDGALGLILTVDVQKHCLYTVVRAWGAWGRDTWLVDRRRIPRVMGRNLIELDQHQPLAYRSVSGERVFHVRAEGIDSGHFASEVYECVRRRKAAGRPYVHAMKGASSGAFAKPYFPSVIDKWPEGTPGGFAGKLIPGGVNLLNFSPDFWKTALMGRIKGRPELDADDGGENSAAKAADGEVPGFYLPREREEGELADYIAQVTAEHRTIKRDKKKQINPRRGLEYVWEIKKGAGGNHYLDCETQNFALAEFLGIRRLAPIGGARTKKAEAKKSEWAAGSGARGGQWKDG